MATIAVVGQDIYASRLPGPCSASLAAESGQVLWDRRGVVVRRRFTADWN